MLDAVTIFKLGFLLGMVCTMATIAIVQSLITYAGTKKNKEEVK